VSRTRTTTFSPSDAGSVETRHGDPVHRDPGAAVLRPQPVGDVQSGDDLDAGDERQPRRPRDLHHLAQHAVDAVPDGDAALLRLDVHVTRARVDPLREDQIHQSHHRSLGGFLRRDGQVLGIHLLFFQRGDLRLRRVHPLEELLDHVLRPIELVDLVTDLAGTGQLDAYLAPRGEGQGLLAVQIEGVGGGHLEVRVGDPDRQDVIPPGHLLGDQLPSLAVALRHVGELETEAGGEATQQRLVGDQLIADHQLPQGIVLGFALTDLIELLRANQLFERRSQPLILEQRNGSTPGSVCRTTRWDPT
jgi:hypothetical protein